MGSKGRRVSALPKVTEPLVSAGKLVRDDDGQPIAVPDLDHLLPTLLSKGQLAQRW
jgi:hypothetical protein